MAGGGGLASDDLLPLLALALALAYLQQPPPAAAKGSWGLVAALDLMDRLLLPTHLQVGREAGRQGARGRQAGLP